MALHEPQPLNTVSVQAFHADISTAASAYCVSPFRGRLIKVYSVIGAAITGADAVITVSHNNTALTPTITIANASSAEGDMDSGEYYRPVNAGDWIEVATDGASSTTSVCAITVSLSQ